MVIDTKTGAEGFTYLDEPQRSPAWIAARFPRLGASDIGEYMAKGVKGQYLAGRKAIEKKIAFSKAFGVPFETFKNDAMQAGIDNEQYMAKQYVAQTGLELHAVGAWYNDWFIASPDRKIVGQNGGIEIKWLFDNSFSELIETGKPDQKHYDQMQGQMWATGWDFVDYVAGNGHTGRFVIVHVERDEQRIEEIQAEGPSVLAIEPLKTDNIYTFTGEAPVPVNPWEDQE